MVHEVIDFTFPVVWVLICTGRTAGKATQAQLAESPSRAPQAGVEVTLRSLPMNRKLAHTKIAAMR